MTPGELYFLVPLDIEVPELLAGKGDLALEDPKNLGLDWGERRLLTGAIVSRDAQDQIATTGRPFYFDPSALQLKQARRRRDAYHLAAEIARLEKDQREAARPTPARAVKIAVLEREKNFLWRRVSQCDRQLEHAGAKWAIATALAEGAGSITTEDIDSLEARGHGKANNARGANQVRGGVQARIREKAELAGIEVVAVLPRGTSSLCSRCQRPSVFWQAPDRRRGRINRQTGKAAAHQNWLVCAQCRSSDRDHAAGEAIGARGFDAPDAKRNSRRKPVAGPASHRLIGPKSEKSQPRTEAHQARALAQTIPFPIYAQAQHPPRSCRAVSSRRVDRGSALPGATQLPERRTLTILEPTEISPFRVLDGLAGGYWRRVHFSRPRALAEPSSSVLTQGM